MKKILSILLLLSLVFGLSGCGMSLPEGMNRDLLHERAQEVVMLLHERDYKAVYAEMRADVQAMTSVDEIQSLFDPLLDAEGPLVEITGVVSTGQKAEVTNEKYGLVVVACQYEDNKRSYNLGFDADFQLIGLYAK